MWAQQSPQDSAHQSEHFACYPVGNKKPLKTYSEGTPTMTARDLEICLTGKKDELEGADGTRDRGNLVMQCETKDACLLGEACPTSQG